jgi:hypothetical protein
VNEALLLRQMLDWWWRTDGAENVACDAESVAARAFAAGWEAGKLYERYARSAPVTRPEPVTQPPRWQLARGDTLC